MVASSCVAVRLDEQVLQKHKQALERKTVEVKSVGAKGIGLIAKARHRA